MGLEINKRIYFPNLNGIRFIAALLVIIHHIEQFKSFYKIDNLWDSNDLFSNIIHIIEPQGVILFFALSGFLITYLMLVEEGNTQTISIRKFYIRRVLRIWPLYLLVVVSTLFILPHFDIIFIPGYNIEIAQSQLWLKFILYITFFASLVFSILGYVPFASQAWSVGTEEQFYIIWPILLKHIKKHRIILLATIILLYNIIYYTIQSDLLINIPFYKVIKAFWIGFAIDNMAVGAFFAFLLYHKKTLLRVFLNDFVFFLSIFALIISLGLPAKLFIFKLQFPILYGIIILNLAANQNFKTILENKLFNYLGSISYGL